MLIHRPRFVPAFLSHRDVCCSGGSSSLPPGAAGADKIKLEEFILQAEGLLNAKQIVPEQISEQMNGLYLRLGAPDLSTLGLRIARVNVGLGQPLKALGILYLLNEAITNLPTREESSRTKKAMISLHLEIALDDGRLDPRGGESDSLPKFFKSIAKARDLIELNERKKELAGLLAIRRRYQDAIRIAKDIVDPSIRFAAFFYTLVPVLLDHRETALAIECLTKYCIATPDPNEDINGKERKINRIFLVAEKLFAMKEFQLAKDLLLDLIKSHLSTSLPWNAFYLRKVNTLLLKIDEELLKIDEAKKANDPQ